LLSVLVSRVDHTRVVNLVGKLGHLAVIKAYLLNVQEVSDQVGSCLSLSLSLFV
jgi:hypothetical protein